MTENTFLKGPILPALIKFSVPILLALVIQALYGAVDLWAVGKFCGKGDVSAVATGSQTMQIITGIVTGLSMGTTVSLGQAIGCNSHKRAADVIGTSVWVFSALGILLSVITVISAPTIATLMNAPDEAFTQTVCYIRICGAGSVFIAGYNLISAVFRGMGNSTAPLLFVIIACVTNIAGDITLIKFFNMGTAGAAVATIAAQAVSVLLSLIIIRKKGLPFEIHKTNFLFKAHTAKNIIRLGSPIALQDMCNEISYLILIGLVNMLGVTASAGVGIAEKLVMFILLIPMAYMQSISAFVAQNTGAGANARAKKAMWLGMVTALCLGGIISYLSFMHGDVMSMIFINDSDTINASAEFLKATAVECLILSVAYCFTGYFNGIGKTAFVMLQGLCAIFLVKLPYAWFASHKAVPKLFDIGLSTAYAALFTLAVCLVYYLLLCGKSTSSGKQKDKSDY